MFNIGRRAGRHKPIDGSGIFQNYLVSWQKFSGFGPGTPDVPRDPLRADFLPILPNNLSK